ncbi:MAG: DUF305 domain-containing protein [Gemmatimonadota bacterium]
MTNQITGMVALGLLTAGLAGCGGASRTPANTGVQPQTTHPAPSATTASTNATRPQYTEPDASFMTNMIGHHAQAVLIAGWAPSHGASPSLQTMCQRIVVGQRDEIGLMSRWLRDRAIPVPASDSMHQMMPGMDPSMMMPGMLSAEQLDQLNLAKGPEFDRLFLTFMIKHHQGAITMVNKLFGSNNAAQDETVFRMASDIYADQSTEIDRMQKMLLTLPAAGKGQ